MFHHSRDKQDGGGGGIHAEIRIHQHYKYRVYSPGVPLTGNLSVTCDDNVTFDKLEISFIGTTVTQNYVQPDNICATLQFIKLRMPYDDHGAFADGKVFRAGKTYTIPIEFVIPYQLPIGSCRHRSISLDLQERHLQLPPTMGYCPGDDQSPEAARVSYVIKAVATKYSKACASSTVLFAAKQPIRVLSSGPEEAPLDCSYYNKIYRLSRTKHYRNWLLMKNAGGDLTVNAWQPRTIMLSSDGRTATSSSIHLELLFVSHLSESPPVKIHSVSGKLLSKTFYNVVPLNKSPAVEPVVQYGNTTPFCYTTRHRLFHSPVGDLQWVVDSHRDQAKRHGLMTHYLVDEQGQEKVHNQLYQQQQHQHQHHGRRRESCPWAQKRPEGPTVLYMAELDIPFAIPHGNNKFFLPSFDACFMSRAYSLNMALHLGPVHGKLMLSLPFQIGVDGNTQGVCGASLGDGFPADTCSDLLDTYRLREPPPYTVTP